MISSAGMYGAEHMLLTLAGELARMGHDCTVAAFDNRDRPNLEVAKRAREMHLPTVQIPCAGRMDRTAIRIIRQIVHERQIDIVHAHGYKADVYCFAALRSTSAAMISTCHNWLGNSFADSIYGVLDRFVLRHFDAVVAVSPAVTQTLLRSGVAANMIRLINNGIDLSRFNCHFPSLLPEVGKAPVIGFVGRLSPEKGLGYLLRAVARICPARHDATLVVVGDGPERASLHKLAIDLGIAARTQFVGYQQDVSRMYASFDLLVLPSLTEGLPLTLLEALACRRAVVASRVGAVPNVVTHEATGLLVAPGDAEALASSIDRLLSDPALRNRLGQQGYALVSEHYSAQAMCGSYLALYEDAMGATRGRFGALRDHSRSSTCVTS